MDMDIDRARTFLEIVHTGSFLKAADRLHVTQTTIGARIRMLEEELGQKLFERSRNGAILTAAGREFERFALSLLQVWERARHQLRLPPDRTSVIALGGELNLWNPLLLEWMIWMKNNQPGVAIRANVGMPDQLIEQLRTGVLDIAVLYAPMLLSGFRVELIEEEELVLVRTPPGAGPAAETGYVHVDWGAQLIAAQELAHSALQAPGVTVGLGPLGLNYILRVGGMGYFRKGAAAPHIEKGELERVAGAPEFTYPAYAVYAESAEARGDVQEALRGLRDVAPAGR